MDDGLETPLGGGEEELGKKRGTTGGEGVYLLPMSRSADSGFLLDLPLQLGKWPKEARELLLHVTDGSLSGLNPGLQIRVIGTPIS